MSKLNGDTIEDGERIFEKGLVCGDAQTVDSKDGKPGTTFGLSKGQCEVVAANVIVPLAQLFENSSCGQLTATLDSSNAKVMPIIKMFDGMQLSNSTANTFTFGAAAAGSFTFGAPAAGPFPLSALTSGSSAFGASPVTGSSTINSPATGTFVFGAPIAGSSAAVKPFSISAPAAGTSARKVSAAGKKKRSKVCKSLPISVSTHISNGLPASFWPLPLATAPPELAPSTQCADCPLATMLPVRKVDIPVYLHNSEFYKSLQDGEEEETILVPSDCLKPNDTVSSNENLRSLLMTQRFWVADCIVDTVIEYVLTRPFQYTQPTLSEFYQDFPALKHLESLTKGNVSMEVAIESGILGLVMYFKKRGDPWPNDAVEKIAIAGHVEVLILALQAGCKVTARANGFAAQHGHVDCLRLLHEYGAPCTAITIQAAIQRGHVKCLQYAHQQGIPIPLDKGLLESAVNSKSVDCVKYLHEDGHPYDQQVCRWAAKNFDTPMVLFLLRNGCPPCDEIWLFGDIEQHKQVLLCFLEMKLPWSATPEATKIVAGIGRPEHLKLLIENGCPWHPNTFASIMLGPGRKHALELIQFAHKNGCPWEPHFCAYAAHYNKLDCLVYAHTHGAVIAPRLCEKILAASNSQFPLRLECFKYVHQHGAVLSRNCTYLAVYHSCPVNVLAYLHEQGCEWDSRAAECAAQRGQADYLEFILSHGGACTEAVYTMAQKNEKCKRVVEKYGQAGSV